MCDWVSSIGHSPNGWTDGELALQWMIKDFDVQTREKAAGQTRVLLLDGHSSHYTPELLEFARDHNIMILGYPPHCTHALQGLDVVCFAKMKGAWKTVIREFEDLHLTKVTKGDFTGLFGKAYLAAFTKDTIEAAFRATGVYPFDRTVIKLKQMKPSETTSVKGPFAITQTSPVCAIISSFIMHAPTSSDISPLHTTQTQSGALEPAPPSVNPNNHLLVPAIGTKRSQDSNPNDTPDSPSKRMRIMTSALASTSSGSFLVSKTLYTSSQPFPRVPERVPANVVQPNWSLLETVPCPSFYQSKNEMEKRILELTESLRASKQQLEAYATMTEVQTAQMVLQDMSLLKMNQTILAKEKKKKDDRTKIHTNGFGRLFTNDECITLVKEQAMQRQEKANKKGKRAAERQTKKAEKEAIEYEWKEIKAAHAKNIESWERYCEKLIEGGVSKKNLPKKPRCPPKPKAPQPSLLLGTSQSHDGQLSGDESSSSSSDGE
jgi:DDE superfamily endonuclease